MIKIIPLNYNNIAIKIINHKIVIINKKNKIFKVFINKNEFKQFIREIQLKILVEKTKENYKLTIIHFIHHILIIKKTTINLQNLITL
jgi:hypothetical protein